MRLAVALFGGTGPLIVRAPHYCGTITPPSYHVQLSTYQVSGTEQQNATQWCLRLQEAAAERSDVKDAELCDVLGGLMISPLERLPAGSP